VVMGLGRTKKHHFFESFLFYFLFSL
jgi:hypothetical protein